MKKPGLAIIGIIAAIVIVIGWKFIFPKKKTDDGPAPQGLTVSEHSSGFNESVSKALNDYYTLAESFVNWDTAKVSASIVQFKISVDSMRIPEMQKDSAIYETANSTWESIKADITGMQLDTSLAERRADLTMLSDNFYNLLRIVKYDGSKVYYHECPMALNDYESSAFWLSPHGETKTRRNPYLGLYDPKYGKSMLTCGVTRDSLNFSATPGDSN